MAQWVKTPIAAAWVTAAAPGLIPAPGHSGLKDPVLLQLG